MKAAVSEHGFLLYIPHPRYLLYSFVRSTHQMRNKFVTALYPLHPLLALTLILLTACYVIIADRER
jgi:hypothetical protein